MKSYLFRSLACLLTCAFLGGLAPPMAGQAAAPRPVGAARTIEFETTEVTAADVALSPDGQWLIFTLLGHLFRLPVEGLPRRSPQGEVAGGTAEQLTFGPYYDRTPVFSPGGTRVAFVSDRDGSEGNIFVLELATREITQVTHEPWAGRPTWTPDGQAIVYLRLVREVPGVVPIPPHSVPETIPALVRRVALDGGQPESLTQSPRVISSVFYLPDGRLACAVVDLKVEREGGPVAATTRIEVLGPVGSVSTLRRVAGYAASVVASPSGDGLYCRRFFPLFFWALRAPEKLLFLPLGGNTERPLTPLSRPAKWPPRFAVAGDQQALYLGEAGRLWKIPLPPKLRGAREPIPFRAQVKLEIQDPVPPPKWAAPAAGSSAPPRSVRWPRLSPDGRSLVFGAAGYLWQQVLDGGQAPLRPGFGGQAQRLFRSNGFDSWPAFSPDGRQLAFVRSQYGKQEIRVFDFASGRTRSLASGTQPSWSPDGQWLVFARYNRLLAVNLRDGKQEKLAESREAVSRPHFTADGQSLYFTAHPNGTGSLYRLPHREEGEPGVLAYLERLLNDVLVRVGLKEGAKPQALTQLARALRDACVSPDGNWLAFRRNTEIWVAPLGKAPIREPDIRRLSPVGGMSFAFTPNSTAVIYAAGNRVRRHPLGGGEREEIPIRLKLQRPTPPPLLVRRVRVLDFPPKAGPPRADAAGGFGPETSLFVEQGRIRWIGSERGRTLPSGTVILDAGGRFAIPGLFDLHMHVQGAYPAVFLAYGVTAIRDLALSLPRMNALADRSEMLGDPMPGYFFSGAVFHGAEPPWAIGHLSLYRDDDPRTYVRRWKQWGAHFLKVYPSLSWPLQRAVAMEARRQGLPVVGHGTDVEEIVKSMNLGYSMLEHAILPRAYDDVLQLLALAGTRWDPTLMAGGHALWLREQPERLVDAKFRAFNPDWVARTASEESPWGAIGEKELRRRLVAQLAALGAAHGRGIQLQAGTDAPVFGASLHWELELFVQAGIPPLEVLRIATQEAAAAVGAEDDLGTLERGKLADIVLLDANPLDDIRNTQTIWRVIKGGWLFDPEKLRPPTEK